jgi:hypothetical protein
MAPAVGGPARLAKAEIVWTIPKRVPILRGSWKCQRTYYFLDFRVTNLCQAGVCSNKRSLTRTVRETKEDAKNIHARSSLDAYPAVQHDAQRKEANDERIYRPQDIICEISHYWACRDTHGVDNKQQTDSFNR